jgi:WD40 repeat protein
MAAASNVFLRCDAWSAAFAPYGGRILTASGDGTARLWNRDGKPDLRGTA